MKAKKAFIMFIAKWRKLLEFIEYKTPKKIIFLCLSHRSDYIENVYKQKSKYDDKCILNLNLISCLLKVVWLPTITRKLINQITFSKNKMYCLIG